ncbi:hypothetical protein Tco_0980670 [Tanacetum coccineum]
MWAQISHNCKGLNVARLGCFDAATHRACWKPIGDLSDKAVCTASFVRYRAMTLKVTCSCLQWCDEDLSKSSKDEKIRDIGLPTESESLINAAKANNESFSTCQDKGINDLFLLNVVLPEYSTKQFGLLVRFHRGYDLLIFNDANDDDNQEDDDKNDDEEETDSDRTKSDRIKIPVLNQSSTKYYKEEEKIHNEEKMDEEEDDEVTKELYKDMNVNLGNEDADITNAESGFEQEEEDAHVTLTTVHDAQKTKGLMHSSSVSSDFTENLLNFKNVSLADNEIASLIDITVHHEEPSSQTLLGFLI